MLRRQYKIIGLVALLLFLWILLITDKYVVVLSHIRTQYNSYFGLTDFYDLDRVVLPDLKEEGRSGNGERLPWYTNWGKARPTVSPQDDSSHLFPDPKRPYHDRISDQLMYIPPDYGPDSPSKLILLYDYLGAWLPHSEGSSAFQGCPVDRCILTTKRQRISDADSVIFDNSFSMPSTRRPANQIWMLYMLESPMHTRLFFPPNVFNWTITYRPDSDLASPYDKWMSHGPLGAQPLRNFAVNKTRQVAWFVSNCNAKSMRLEYAKELAKYIQVDIFGSCGSMTCPRSSQDACYKLLVSKYKFYLAFENSNCNYYITEKFFKNALRHNVVPIVMGGRRGDYEAMAPRGSFIHVDDFSSPQQLAEYLHQLDNNDQQYNRYFHWRGTGEFIGERLFCRMCTMLHSNYPKKYYKDINYWWRGNQACSTNF